jgi:hypothetical protein
LGVIDGVTITRKAKGGEYCDVLDAAAYLSRECGSACNAIATMARESDRFKKAVKAGAVRTREQNPQPAVN